jgi:hypothetical protein
MSRLKAKEEFGRHYRIARLVTLHAGRRNPLLGLHVTADNAAMLTEPPKAESPRKRRWFQFSLRTLFVVVTLLAVPCN